MSIKKENSIINTIDMKTEAKKIIDVIDMIENKNNKLIISYNNTNKDISFTEFKKTIIKRHIDRLNRILYGKY